MKAVGFVGASGVGKTTLIEGVIAALRASGQRVSVIKHAHKRFDIDTPGKDSWRHRQAGATEVLLASHQRLALLREFGREMELDVHELLAELAPCDWALVEGFKHADLPKIELRRPSHRDEPALYVDDPFVVAVATDAPLPMPTQRPVFAIADAAAVAAWLQDHASRFEYAPAHG